MRVGLLFGSFNPIHHGHLIIASYVVNENLVEQVWFVVSPLNPFKDKKDLISEYSRLHMVSLAIEGMNKFRTCDVEFKLTRPSYTIHTLDKLRELHPEHDFYLIVGGDSFQNIIRWKDGNRIIQEFNILVYNRKGQNINEDPTSKVKFLEAPIIEISSTAIRSMIGKNLSVKYYLPDQVIEEINRCGLYKK